MNKQLDPDESRRDNHVLLQQSGAENPQARGSGVANTTLFVHDLNGHLLGEYDGNGAALREYIWLDDIPVAMMMPDANAASPVKVFYINADHLDTPRIVVDPNN